MKAKAPLNLLIDIRAWLEQTATLTPAENGAFLKLKMHYWRSGQIPDRDTALAQIVGMGIKEWKEARQGLEPLFVVGQGEWFRTDWNDELQAAYDAVRKASENGKKAIKARWDKEKSVAKASDTNTQRITTGIHGEYAANTPSLLKYKGKAPSQEVNGFVSADAELEQAISALESGWKEAANV